MFDYEKLEDVATKTESYLQRIDSALTSCAVVMAALNLPPVPFDSHDGDTRLIEYPDQRQDDVLERELRDHRM